MTHPENTGKTGVFEAFFQPACLDSLDRTAAALAAVSQSWEVSPSLNRG
jgi:hypothetical protein